MLTACRSNVFESSIVTAREVMWLLSSFPSSSLVISVATAVESDSTSGREASSDTSSSSSLINAVALKPADAWKYFQLFRLKFWHAGYQSQIAGNHTHGCAQKVRWWIDCEVLAKIADWILCRFLPPWIGFSVCTGSCFKETVILLE